MELEINLNGYGPTIEELLEEELKSRGIPECFGHMTPPVLYKTTFVDDMEFFKLNLETPRDQVVKDMKVEDLTTVPQYITQNAYIVDTEGKTKFENVKKDIIKEYVNHVEKCIKCPIQDTCYRITICYLHTINTQLTGEKEC